MDVYRISKKEYAAIDGIGGLFFSGRWHYAGHKVVYTAEHRSLAALEYLVHLSVANLLATDYVMTTIRIPDSLPVKKLSVSELPVDWTSFRKISYTQNLGTSFLKMNEYAIYKVPSAVISNEYNFILNPAYSEFKKCKIVDIQTFSFDNRLVKS